MITSRRRFLESSSALLALGSVALAAAPAAAQGAYDPAEIAKPGTLPDMALGDPKAPATMIAYTSMTCGHCANFHKNVYPYLKTKYIDTGKVYFIHREFPLDPLAAAVSMLARCSPKEKYFDMLDLFFDKQSTWVRSNDPVNALLDLSKQVGFTQDSFKACLTNQQLLDEINQGRERASTQYRVDSTPSFFVNGRPLKGLATTDELDKVLAPLVK